MLRDRDLNLRIEETAIGASSPVVGRAIRDANLRAHTDALILALRSPDGGFAYNPGPDTVLKAGVRLVVLGQRGRRPTAPEVSRRRLRHLRRLSVSLRGRLRPSPSRA